MSVPTHDLIVIGSGPGGYVAAIRAGQLGLKTLVVERDGQLGGTCLLRGCIPTKALLHTADLLRQAREASKFGVICSEVTLDLAAAHAHKDRVVTKNAKGVEFLFRKNKVAWVQGTGKLLGRGLVEVTRPDGSVEQHGAPHILLATG
ncbi:MAG: FAD-dependent oxidoreductase, partial [Acidobacteriota bacterium]